MATMELETVDGERGAACAALLNRFWAEAVPGERPIPTAELRAEAVQSPPHRSIHRAMAVATEGEPAGVAALVVDRLRSRDAWLRSLFVAPEHRGRGDRLRAAPGRAPPGVCGGQAADARHDDRRPRRGARFAENAGGKAGLVVDLNRCLTADFDPAELHRWVERATERAHRYSLVSFDGVCAEDHLEAFAAAVPIMSAAPHRPALASPQVGEKRGVAVANPGQPTIGPGASGDAVKRSQRAIRRTPNPGLVVDGVFGPATEAAVKQFQRSAGLDDDGIVGPLTWNALPHGGPMPLLQEGATGFVVARLQNVLTNGAPGQWNTGPGPVDEIFGPRTKASVEALQGWAGVPVDGVVGDRTWSVSLHAMHATLESVVGLNHALD